MVYIGLYILPGRERVYIEALATESSTETKRSTGRIWGPTGHLFFTNTPKPPTCLYRSAAFQLVYDNSLGSNSCICTPWSSNISMKLRGTPTFLWVRRGLLTFLKKLSDLQNACKHPRPIMETPWRCNNSHELELEFEWHFGGFLLIEPP